MSSEDEDRQPLLGNTAAHSSRSNSYNLTSQTINFDPDYEQVVYGYRKSRWRAALVYFLSVLLAGIPFLVFHWCPTWRLYLTCLQCDFLSANYVLLVEIYQEKCKSSFIHRIKEMNLGRDSGQSNPAYQGDICDGKPTNEDLTPIYLEDGTILRCSSYRHFTHKKCVAVWEGVTGRWVRLAGVDSGATCLSLHKLAANTTTKDDRLTIYGQNEIKVPVQSVLTLILLEVFNPFYVFQVFTIAVWLAEPYYYYCIAIVIMSVFGVATSVLQTKKNQNSLRATVETHDRVEVVTEGGSSWVDSRQVAPGDVIVLHSNSRLHCDAVLLVGTALLNESMLTGESVPVTKTALPQTDRAYDGKEHAAHTLFCGTHLIQTRSYPGEPVRALVLRTGYNTSKGQLVRSILYPAPADFKFDRDSYKFIVILAGIALVGLAYTVALKSYRSLTPSDITLKALDILTIVISPALPAAMTVGRLYAVSRLKRARIACLNTRAVNVSGSIDCLAFDKTGTLTEDGLDMWGVVPVSRSVSPPALTPTPVRDPRTLNNLDDLKLGMATCHSLTLLDGKMAGDPLDLKMFESIDWILEEPPVPEDTNYDVLTPSVVRPRKHANIDVDNVHMPLQVGIIAQNQFVSSLQRASVVVRILGENVCRVYCKGAPEKLRTLCDPSTVPANLDSVLSHYAEKGYRVIAMSTRIVEYTYKQLQSVRRDELECELEFLGLVILENRLKAATTPIIRELKEANIHIVMITGDNIHTAVSVAKECDILQSGARVVTMQAAFEGKIPVIYCESTIHGVPVGKRHKLRHGEGAYTVESSSGAMASYGLASAVEQGFNQPATYSVVMSGDTWKVLREHFPSVIPRVIVRGAVFARMSPEQKQQLILEYQAIGYYVGMCGDGANDCGALRAAHTGISLSELESSVAAPFTSQDPDIICVARVLREGRAALTTSFGVFKFMIAYSLAEFISVAFLYYFDSNLTDFQFLFIDVVLIVNFAFFFGKTEAYTGKLYPIPPLTSLLGLIPLVSLLGQLILLSIAQYLSYYAITLFPWYVRHTYEGEEANKCFENYAIFAVSIFQYIVLAIVFSHGAPYRRSVITNKLLMVSILICTALCVYIVVKPADWLAEFLELQMPKDILMAYIVVAIACIHFLIAVFFERFIVEFLMEQREVIPKFVKENRVKKTPHLLLKRQLSNNDYLDYDDIVTINSESGTNSSTPSTDILTR